MMRRITAEQIREAMIAGSITEVPGVKCDQCGVPFYYRREDDRLLYDLSCRCKVVAPYPLSWEVLAEHINSQTDPELQRMIATQYGLVLGPFVEPERNGHGHAPETTNDEGQ